MQRSSKYIKTLCGHSGCTLGLYKNDDCLFVKKQSSGPKYNFRLKKQCVKQARFADASNTISAPKVLSSGVIDDKFYFDMEFIKGQTLAQYADNILITEIADFIRLLFANLYDKNEKKDSRASKIFKNKIESLKSSIKPSDLINEAFNVLNQTDWQNVPKSPCHGDLTLENIIITQDKKIYLIDFLDTFYNSWMIDIAKLLQDLELHWSFRKEGGVNSTKALRLLVAKEALIEELRIKNQDISIIYSILLLNLLRIYPYTKDEETKAFLDVSTEKILNKLNTKEVIKL